MRRDTYFAGEITEGSASRISKTIKDTLYRMKLQEIDWGKHSIERPVRPTPVYFDVTGHEVADKTDAVYEAGISLGSRWIHVYQVLSGNRVMRIYNDTGRKGRHAWPRSRREGGMR